MNNINVDDGYRVVFADATQDDWKDKNKPTSEKKGNARRFRSFVFPAKYHDQSTKTSKELLESLKPHATIIPFIDQNTTPLIYDRDFFNDSEYGEAFIDFWDSIVQANPRDADRIMTRIFRTISQTSLKMEYLYIKEFDGIKNLEDFFEEFWDHDDDEKNYHKKFIKKLSELEMDQDGNKLAMHTIYKKLCKDFPDLPVYIENICYHTFVRIRGTLHFGPIGVIPKHTLN